MALVLVASQLVELLILAVVAVGVELEQMAKATHHLVDTALQD